MNLQCMTAGVLHVRREEQEGNGEGQKKERGKEGVKEREQRTVKGKEREGEEEDAF